jgi:hypothetical protein
VRGIRFASAAAGGHSAMLTALLETPLGENRLPSGPTPFFICEGETLKTASGEHVAVHRGGLWQAGNLAYISISIETPVILTFNDSAAGAHAQFGPFPRIRIVNGSIWIKKDQHVELLAHFSDINWQWTIYPMPTVRAGILKITPAESHG